MGYTKSSDYEFYPLRGRMQPAISPEFRRLMELNSQHAARILELERDNRSLRVLCDQLIALFVARIGGVRYADLGSDFMAALMGGFDETG